MTLSIFFVGVGVRMGLKMLKKKNIVCVGQCSVTCGEGHQTREVVCVGARGEPLADHACSGLVRPASVQACRRPACYTRITWHVTSYGLVSE